MQRIDENNGKVLRKLIFYIQGNGEQTHITTIGEYKIEVLKISPMPYQW